MFKAVIQFLTQTVWALDEATFNNMKAIALRLADGGEKTAKAWRDERPSGTAALGYTIQNGVAVVPVSGVITRSDYYWWGNNCNLDELTRAVNAAVLDTRAQAILLDVDSPGGETAGVAEAADTIFAARAKKKVFAYARGQMCSAAYWLGSQAEKVFAGKASPVGNIGVYTSLIDSSKAAADAGLTVHLVKAGALKGIGEAGVPISKEQLAEVQNFVDSIYGVFVDAVAKGRGMKAARVKAFADGRTVLGEEGLELGLIDGVESFDATLARLAGEDSQPKVKASKGKTTMAKMTCPHCEEEFETEDEKKKKDEKAEDSKEEKKDDDKKEKAKAEDDKKEEKKEEKKDAEALRQEGILAERKYRGEFIAAMDVAGIKGADRKRFEDHFYGRAIADVKFMASGYLSAATPAAGEGGGEPVPLTESGEKAKDGKTTAAQAAANWNNFPDLRRAFGYAGSGNPQSEEFTKARERYVKAATA